MSNPPEPLRFPFSLPLWSCQLETRGRVRVRTRAQVERNLVSRALRDPVFRHALVDDPKTQLEDELGHQLAPSLQVTTLEETGVARYLILPHNPLDQPGTEGWTPEEAVAWVLDGRRLSLLDGSQAHELVVHAWTDAVYRSRLLDAPGTLLRDEFGVVIDHGARLHVRAESEDRIYLLIPDLYGYNELSDDDLEELISFVNQPLVVGSVGDVRTCTIKTTVSPWGCGTH